MARLRQPLDWDCGFGSRALSAKRDPAFVDVVHRHLRIPGHLNT